MVKELKKLTARVQSVEGSKGIEGLNYENLCIQPDIELLEGYKPPKFEIFDGTGDLKVNWVSMAADFMDRFRFNTENAHVVFYIQNVKNKQTETFNEYAIRWRSEAAKVRPALEEE
ncbi:uncharacterized protein [Nicotiana tomentosiformis]|uniref:uncharacterized protein n=1 Tax=Nicotiana tomentosiformis TaxID=4098 RepID=UPI00388C3AD3